jgi:Major Facilitator Superfamily./Sugar (and other) transporter.
MEKKVARRVLIASLVGTSIEWFDYFLYGTVAGIVFNKVFFPNEDPVVSLLLAYATFALSFFIRPLGGIIFAHIGDRIGRKKTLILTLSLMGLATAGMGLLPTYESIGVLAPILLITLRLIQGIGLGGEWGGALLLAYEYAPENRRGYFGCIPQMGVTIGLLLGTLVMSIMTSVMSEESFFAWGWRVPFILSLVLVILGFWIRQGVDETPVFKKVQERGEVARVPLFETFRSQPKQVLIAIGGKVVETAPFYIFGTFIVSYAVNNLGIENTVALNAVTIAAIVTTIFIPVMGKLSDRFGRKPLYVTGAVLMMAYAFPYFWILEQRTPLAIIVATVLGLGIIWSPITAVLGTMFSEIFRSNVRYTGVSLGYQIGAALAGGTAPLIATALLREFDNSFVPIAVYIIFTALVSLTAIAFARPVKESEEGTVGDVKLDA